MSVICSGLRQLPLESGKRLDPYVCPRRGNCTRHMTQVSSSTETYGNAPVDQKTGLCIEFKHVDHKSIPWHR